MREDDFSCFDIVIRIKELLLQEKKKINSVITVSSASIWWTIVFQVFHSLKTENTASLDNQVREIRQPDNISRSGHKKKKQELLLRALLSR